MLINNYVWGDIFYIICSKMFLLFQIVIFDFVLYNKYYYLFMLKSQSNQYQKNQDISRNS